MGALPITNLILKCWSMSGQGHKMFHASFISCKMRKMTAHSPSCTLISPHLHIINFSTVPFLLHIFISDFIIPPPNQLTGLKKKKSTNQPNVDSIKTKVRDHAQEKMDGADCEDGWMERGMDARWEEERNGFCRWWKLMKLMKITGIYPLIARWLSIKK